MWVEDALDALDPLLHLRWGFKFRDRRLRVLDPPELGCRTRELRLPRVHVVLDGAIFCKEDVDRRLADGVHELVAVGTLDLVEGAFGVGGNSIWRAALRAA